MPYRTGKLARGSIGVFDGDLTIAEFHREDHANLFKDALEKAPALAIDDDGNPRFPVDYDAETVRSECQLMRIMDNEVLFTHHDKYVDGVYWETEDLPLAKIAEAFGESWP